MGTSGQCQGGRAALGGAAGGSLQGRTRRGEPGPHSLHVAWWLWVGNPAGKGLGDPGPCPHGGHLAGLLPGHAPRLAACSPPGAASWAGLVARGHGATGAGCQRDSESGERWGHHPGHPLVYPNLTPPTIPGCDLANNPLGWAGAGRGGQGDLLRSQLHSSTAVLGPSIPTALLDTSPPG